MRYTALLILLCGCGDEGLWIPEQEQKVWEDRFNRRIEESARIHPPSAHIVRDPRTKEIAWKNYQQTRKQYPRFTCIVKVTVSKAKLPVRGEDGVIVISDDNPDGPYVITLTDSEGRVASLWLSGGEREIEHEVNSVSPY